MFGMGGNEIFIVLAIVLLLFGPTQIPKMARGLGQAMREFRRAHREVRDEVTREDDETPKSPDSGKPGS